jgi:hypothetical protein
VNPVLPKTIRGRRVTLDLVTSGLADLLRPFGSNRSICNLQLGCDPADLSSAIDRELGSIAAGLSAYYRVSDADREALAPGAHIKIDFHGAGCMGFHGGMAKLDEHRSASWIEAMSAPMAHLFDHGCQHAITSVRADNDRALHFLEAIGFKRQRTARFLRSGRSRVMHDQCFLANDRAGLLASPIVRRYLIQPLQTTGTFEIKPRRLTADDPDIQLDRVVLSEVQRIEAIASSCGFLAITPSAALDKLLNRIPRELIMKLIPGARASSLEAEPLRAFLDLNYRINTTRYFALFDRSDSCCALLSVFVGAGARFSINLQASVGETKIAQERFAIVMGDHLLPALLRSVQPDRVQCELDPKQIKMLDLWRTIGMQDEGMDPQSSRIVLSLGD